MKEKKEKKQNGYFRHMAEAIKMELREHKKFIYGVSYFADSSDRDVGAPGFESEL